MGQTSSRIARICGRQDVSSDTASERGDGTRRRSNSLDMARNSLDNQTSQRNNRNNPPLLRESRSIGDLTNQDYINTLTRNRPDLQSRDTRNEPPPYDENSIVAGHDFLETTRQLLEHPFVPGQIQGTNFMDRFLDPEEQNAGEDPSPLYERIPVLEMFAIGTRMEHIERDFNQWLTDAQQQLPSGSRDQTQPSDRLRQEFQEIGNMVGDNQRITPEALLNQVIYERVLRAWSNLPQGDRNWLANVACRANDMDEGPTPERLSNFRQAVEEGYTGQQEGDMQRRVHLLQRWLGLRERIQDWQERDRVPQLEQ